MALSRALSAVLQVPPKCVEVGATILTNDGALTHIVQSVYRSELAKYAEALRSLGNDVDEVTPRLFVEQTLAASMNEISAKFREHFQLGHDFCVELHDSMQRHKSTINSRSASFGVGMTGVTASDGFASVRAAIGAFLQKGGEKEMIMGMLGEEQAAVEAIEMEEPRLMEEVEQNESALEGGDDKVTAVEMTSTNVVYRQEAEAVEEVDLDL